MTRKVTQRLGVEGQWILEITLSSSEDKVQINQLENFTLIEETGNLLPTWKISFSAGAGLEKEWNESSEIPIQLSESSSSPEKITSKLQIVRPSVESQTGQLKHYTATGLFNAPAFTQTPFLTTSPSTSGTNVLQNVAKKHFQKVITDNMTESEESQAWIQSNTTDKKFLDYVASHCYIENSFVGTGITSSGYYVIVDVVKLSNKKEDYTISSGNNNSIDGGKNLMMLNPPQAESNSGFMNAMGGFGMDTPIISIDSGLRAVHRPDIKFGFVSNKHSEIPNVNRKTLAPVKCSMSNDPKTYMAKANFDCGNALLSMENVVVTVSTKFFPIKIWDVVNLLAPEQDNPNLNTNLSGKYVVTKVSRVIESYNLYTHLFLSRDAHNETQ